MLILPIRSDKPDAEVGLFEDQQQLDYTVWQAHRELSMTIHQKIAELLERQHKQWADIKGIVAFKGPGSFTGLRIGLSVANALSYSLGIPVIASNAQDWIQAGIRDILAGKSDLTSLPDYGAEAFTTKAKK